MSEIMLTAGFRGLVQRARLWKSLAKSKREEAAACRRSARVWEGVAEKYLDQGEKALNERDAACEEIERRTAWNDSQLSLYRQDAMRWHHEAQQWEGLHSVECDRTLDALRKAEDNLARAVAAEEASRDWHNVADQRSAEIVRLGQLYESANADRNAERKRHLETHLELVRAREELLEFKKKKGKT